MMAFNWITTALSKVLTDKKLDTIIGLLEGIQRKEVQIMATIAELEQQIRESVAVEQSAVLLIQGFKERLEAAGVDPVKLDQLKADLDASEQNLAAAVAANTPEGTS
jgi:hypothetical protein